jgi:hypothetical protein
MEPEEQIELAIARLSRMGLPITSVEQGVVTIDVILACLVQYIRDWYSNNMIELLHDNWSDHTGAARAA